MLDYRIMTFLTLCDTMNYRITAEKLNMTQPAVTQHIHYLEKVYGCKLFSYDSKTLIKTTEANIVEQCLRSMKYNQDELFSTLKKPSGFHLKVGATKTIGEFVIGEQITNFLNNKDNSISITVDNTMNLLHVLERGKLDFALIEGYFDKQKYDYRLLRKEQFVGICSAKHTFAGKEVIFEDLLSETLILRENGSGTREIFEQVLHEQNYSLESFRKIVYISSFSLIQKLVSSGIGISFVYEAVSQNVNQLANFTIKDYPILKEFNYVYLKNTSADIKIDKFNMFFRTSHA